jgi:hypothetical protein
MRETGRRPSIVRCVADLGHLAIPRCVADVSVPALWLEIDVERAPPHDQSDGLRREPQSGR